MAKAIITTKKPVNQRVKGAEPIVVDGMRFDSKREARRWGDLQLLLRAGEITDLQRQVTIVLQGQDGPLKTPSGRDMRYIADFRYLDSTTDEIVYEDAKGHPTEVYLIKRAILAAQGVRIREV